MRVITQFGWVYYIGDDAKTLVNDKCGKWMYFFDNKTFVSNLCAKAAIFTLILHENLSPEDKLKHS